MAAPKAGAEVPKAGAGADTLKGELAAPKEVVAKGLAMEATLLLWDSLRL